MTPPGELEYGSILPNGEDWRLRRCDAGLYNIIKHTVYRIFRNEIFFAQCDNRKDADIVMSAMCHTSAATERDTVLDEIIKMMDNINHGCSDDETLQDLHLLAAELQLSGDKS